MSDVTTIACWPACADAIDWSHDGIIAFASEEQVELLVSEFEGAWADAHLKQRIREPLFPC